VCRGLRAHGRALAALAAGPDQPLDTTAIENTANLVLDHVTHLNATTDFGKAASHAGSVFATASKRIVDALRTKKIEQAVAESQTCMGSTFEDLLALEKIMAATLVDVQKVRASVVRNTAAASLQRRSRRAYVLAEAMDAVGETDHSFKATGDALHDYEQAITKLRVAYEKLVKLAVRDPNDPGSPNEVSGALDDLESSLQDLTEMEQ
jgi:hypothetical protein